MMMKYGFITIMGIAGVIIEHQRRGSIKYTLPIMTVTFALVFVFFLMKFKSREDVHHLNYRILFGDLLQFACFHFFLTLTLVE